MLNKAILTSAVNSFSFFLLSFFANLYHCSTILPFVQEKSPTLVCAMSSFLFSSLPLFVSFHSCTVTMPGPGISLRVGQKRQSKFHARYRPIFTPERGVFPNGGRTAHKLFVKVHFSIPSYNICKVECLVQTHSPFSFFTMLKGSRPLASVTRKIK